jgi:hypothetical protein
MKIALSLALLTGSIFLLGQGCDGEDKKSEFKPISGGFGVMAQWVGIDSGPRAELYYKTNNSKPVLIWPFLTGEMYYTNDLFFFVGDVRDAQGRLGDSRYFAVKAPGPAMDVSDDLLKRFADSNRLDFEKVKKKYSPLQLKKASEGIEVRFLGPYQQPDTLLISWQQLSNIIQDVKRTGKQHAVEDPHTVYLKKDY